MSTKQNSVTLTTRDVELLTAAFKCARAEVKLDFHKFAEMVNFKNATSAQVSWNNLKKKMDKIVEIGKAAPTASPIASPADVGQESTGSKKRKVAAIDNDELGSETEATLTKATTGHKKKKGKTEASSVTETI